MDETRLGLEPRGLFAERFALLYAEAGDLPLKRVTESVARARRVDERGRPLRVTVQRVSDWRRGRNVPARFAALAAVLEILIGEARRRRPVPVVHDLYDLAPWNSLWKQALESPITSSPAADDRAGDVEFANDPPHGTVSVCPYRGLASFRRQDATRFFGRGSDTTALVDKLLEGASAGGMTMLVGASGAGKSSLIAAGLLPALGEVTLPDTPADDWAIVTMTPRDDPMSELTTRVPELGGILELGTDVPAVDTRESEVNDASTVNDREHDPDNPDQLTGFVRTAIAAHLDRQVLPARRLVLVVDQFEESFTLCTDDVRRRLFIRTLHAASQVDPATGRSAAIVLLGLRADFYGHCLEHPELAEALQARQLVLGPMTTAELREAITGPAKSVGLQLESGLVDLIVRDVGVGTGRTRTGVPEGVHDAGVLPLLSHALLATWQRRHSGKLTVDGYKAARGIHGAVAATAERAWSELDQQGQAAARAMLVRLVRLGEDMRDTRRRSTRQQLVEQAENPAAADLALEVLTQARLVTLDARSVEITHEALLQAWPRLRGWIDQDRAGNLVRQRLEEDAASWDEQGRDSSLLYRGARLEGAAHGAQAAGPDVTVVAREFLNASARQSWLSTWTRRVAVAAVVVFALIATSAAVIAFQQRDDAQFQQVVSEADRLRASDPSLSAQLDLVAHRLRPDDENVLTRLLSTQQSPLATPLIGHTGFVYWTSFSPDGKTLATASYDQTVRLWDVRDRSRPRPLGAPLGGHTSWVASAVFSPDGKVLVTAGDDHTFRLWNVADPARPSLIGQPNRSDGGTIYTATISPDGRLLATANSDGSIRLWNIADPRHPAQVGMTTGDGVAVRSVAFSPDGRTLASGGNDRGVRLWDVSAPDRPVPRGQPLAGHTAIIHSVAFSPDGHTLASGSADKTVRLWDLTSPAGPTSLGQPLTGHSGDIWQVAFSADGRTLASGGDNTVRLWNLSSRSNVKALGTPLTASNGSVFSVAFSPDSRTIAIGSEDGMARLWSLPGSLLLGHRSAVTSVAFSPDGRTLATGDRDNSVQLWDLSDPTAPRPLNRPITGRSGEVNAVTFSPDGRVLATSVDDSTIQLWDVAGSAAPAPLGQPLRLATKYGSPVLFSPDGRLLLTGSDDKTLQLWDVREPAHPTAVGRPLPGHPPYAGSAAFSPDSRVLATSNNGNGVQLWNIADPAHATPLGHALSGHTAPVRAIAFSPDGRVLATGSDDQTLRLWNVADPTSPSPTGQPLTGHTDAVNSVMFSPDGKTVVAGSSDQTFRLWAVSASVGAVPIGQPIGADTDATYVVAFDPRSHLIATGGADSTVRLWSLDQEQAIQRICHSTENVLTPEQWQQHIPQLDYHQPCR